MHRKIILTCSELAGIGLIGMCPMTGPLIPPCVEKLVVEAFAVTKEGCDIDCMFDEHVTFAG